VYSFKCSDAEERGVAQWLHYGDMGTAGSAPGADAVRDAIVAHELKDPVASWDLALHIGDIAYAFGHEHIWREWAEVRCALFDRVL
jgi:hypothetical protein